MKRTLNAECSLRRSSGQGTLKALTPAHAPSNRGGGMPRFGFRSSFIVHRSAFSFIEIMFAVIILGIGFIMVAALFPVAIQQTQASSQDVTASAYAQSIAQSLSSSVSSADFPPTGQSVTGGSYPPMFVSFGTYQAATEAVPPSTLVAATPFSSTSIPTASWTLWNKISGSLINSTDSRFGWVGFYSRDEDKTAPNANPKSYVNVVAIVTQNQNPNAGNYTSLDLTPTATGRPATLQGWPINVQILDSSDQSVSTLAGKMTADVVLVQQGAPSPGAPAVVPGAFIVTSQDLLTTTHNGYWNGRVYRVANRRTDLDTYAGGYQVWELAPGQDFTPETYGGVLVTGIKAHAFVVGRTLANTTNANPPPDYNANTNPFVGGSQAIAAYSFTIAVQ